MKRLHSLFAALTVALMGCGESPVAPDIEINDVPQQQVTYQEVWEYFSEQGITLPDALPVMPAGKVVSDCSDGYVAIRGNVQNCWNGKFDNAINAIDFFAFYNLAYEYLFINRKDFLLNVKGQADKIPYQIEADIDGDDDVDWFDFVFFVDYLYGSKLNPHNIGDETSPDLVVTTSVSASSLTTGQSFTLSATVRNSGTGRSDSTTLRYYRSSDATISTNDTEVGTDPVGALGASRTIDESIRLNAPSSAGTHYYGACVESVSGESNTNNNCSRGVRVTVEQEPDDEQDDPYRIVKSFPANFSYFPGLASLEYRIASSDIDDGLLGVSGVRVGFRYRESVFGWEVTEVNFTYNLRVSEKIPSNTTLRARIVYEMVLVDTNPFPFPRVVETYTVSLRVVVK